MGNKSGHIEVLIVDDHALFRNGLKILLNNLEHIHVADEASNGKEFLQILEKMSPDVVLLDIAMPEMDGVEAASIAMKMHPDLNIITLSMYGDEAYYNQMLDAGVRGFILKDSEIQEVETAIRSVYNGKTYFSQELLQNILGGFQHETPIHTYDLSDREFEVIRFICQGMANYEIADQMNISKRTVEKHRSNILEKTDCKNTASLVIFAIKNKIVKV